MNATSLEARLAGTPTRRFVLELFGNSAHFPIANILLEMLLEGPLAYVRAPDFYAISLACVVQAYALSRWETTSRPRRFWGNLIGPALYTVVESAFEGPAFFARPHHLAYWGFAIAIGLLQTVRRRRTGASEAAVLITESVTRASILLALYAIFESFVSPTQWVSLAAFFSDRSHLFVALAIPLLGLSAALAGLTADRYLDLLRRTSDQLRTYSEWLLGRDLLDRIVVDPNALTPARRERAVLFIDIRGFTRWSETRPPEEVVAMLDRYYLTAETVLLRHAVVKFKFAADEVLAVFPTVALAAAASLDLRAQAGAQLAERGLGVGIGVHAGPLVEGLLGSAAVKFYDVIGDTVNTAKRIEGAAGAGEILLSDPARQALAPSFRVGASRQVAVKGKDLPLTVHRLE